MGGMAIYRNFASINHFYQTLIDKTMKIKNFFLFALLCSMATGATAQTYYKNKAYQWKGNEIIQGKEKGRAVSATEMTSNYQRKIDGGFMGWENDPINRQRWTLSRDLAALPQYTGGSLLEQANYNLSLQESLEAIETDQTFRTGIFWGGVWTRDVSYSILHALAQLHPEISKNSLLAKVNANNRIIQDTGTGGAWPCSTDRTTWILAAWELYKVTGEKEWLDCIYPVIRNTIEDDRIVAYDPETKLMRGETSYLDWREQEYPSWMQPNDIYQSETLGTTAVHYQSLRILSEISRLEGQSAESAKYAAWANDLAEGINRHLWIEEKGYYGIYLYGRRHQTLHPQSETLGEALAILFGIADEARARRITASVVNMPFGTPCIYPNLGDQPPYHNDATWPFVQGYWMRANAKAGNEEGLLHSISSIYRGATLWLSNQENYVVYDGDYGNTQINSARQLWSVAANLAVVPAIYFGINYELDGIHFTPFVPKVMKGERTLANFRYRDAVLTMTVKGFGNQIKRFVLDGQEMQQPLFPANLKGEHTIVMELSNQQPERVGVTYAENRYQPNTPVVKLQANQLTWEAIPGAATYRVMKNGVEIAKVETTTATCQGEGEYQVQALDATGFPSFASEPIYVDGANQVQLYEVEQYAKASDGKNVCISRNENILITIPVEIPADGTYAIDWRYANGNGPINTENKCATRLLKVDGRTIGVSVFAQRGENKWDNWGWSSVMCASLKAGHHTLTLEFADCVENMNITENKALLDQLRIVRIK